jgi:hypothetical protein
MTAGAAQILLKQSGLVPQRAVLAGSGPLLYLLASQMIAAGAPPLALVETSSMRDVFAAALKLRPNAHHRELPETGREDAGRHQKGRRAALPCGARYTCRRRGYGKGNHVQLRGANAPH